MVASGLLLVRLVLATILAMHGSHVLFGTSPGEGAGPGGLAETARYFASIGVAPSMAFAAAAGILQLAGAVLIAAGYFTRAMSGALLTLTCLEIWKDSARWGFFLDSVNDPTRGNGLEYGFLMAGVFVCLLLAGAGEWSLDGVRSHSAAARAAGRARLRRP